jgi:hypothetical protein
MAIVTVDADLLKKIDADLARIQLFERGAAIKKAMGATAELRLNVLRSKDRLRKCWKASDDAGGAGRRPRGGIRSLQRFSQRPSFHLVSPRVGTARKKFEAKK